MARNVLTPWQRAARIADTQRGLLTLRQLKSAGVTAQQAERAVEVRGWERPARGLYALPGSTASWQRDVTAALLLAGDDALGSHLTAAAVWTWTRPPVLPHLIVPFGQSTRTRLARIHRSVVAGVDRTTRDGLRVTSASRTLVDCAGIVERPRLEQFVDDALCARVATPASVRAAAARAGRKGRAGVGVLDEVLDVWSEDIRPGSPGEVRLLRRLAALGVDAVAQYEVRDERGTFVARLDAACPRRRHGFEYDSDRWHNPRQFAKDEARYARLAALGWRVDAVCKHDLLPSSTRLAEVLAAAAAA